jgi:tetratricopeptide (TPR) repeat protein
MWPAPPLDVELAIQRFCEVWRPVLVTEAEALAAIVEEYAGTLGAHNPVCTAYLRLLVVAHPVGRTRSELIDALDGTGADDTGSTRLYQWRRQLNRDLMAMVSNPLQYQVYTAPDDAPELIERERREVLRPLSVFTLLGRTRAAAHADPQLREGWARYDRGMYLDCARTLVGLLDARRRGRMTVSELTLLFYYLAKALLKLNWYDLLDRLLDGPYQLFSTTMVNGDLEAERLQIHAISLRQRGRPADAADCLREAVRLLEDAAARHRHPSITMTLADAEVLLVQTCLDQALGPDEAAGVRQVRLRQAQAELARAKIHYEQWWSEAENAEPTHYEGRLNGTSAFVTVARSVIEPDTIDVTHWELAERNARMAYEPRRYRKPFGIVAGNYAHAVVLLAKARWYEARPAGDPDGIERRAALQTGRRLLQETRRRFLDNGDVILGRAYEGPKYYGALKLFDRLLSVDQPYPPWPDPAAAQLLTPLV